MLVDPGESALQSPEDLGGKPDVALCVGQDTGRMPVGPEDQSHQSNEEQDEKPKSALCTGKGKRRMLVDPKEDSHSSDEEPEVMMYTKAKARCSCT